MNNNLTTLENAIYNSIPRLRELSSGCEIDSDFYGIFPAIVIDKEYNTIYGVDKENQYRSVEIRRCKIIGHQILLNDVLEWLKGLGWNIYQPTIQNIINNWNLSKPALKDQSQELIDALCELIPKQLLIKK